MSITRRAILSGGLVTIGTALLDAQAADKEQAWIVTFPRDIKANEPIRVTARDRIWALASLGATVWTEAEWAHAEEAVKKFRQQYPVHDVP